MTYLLFCCENVIDPDKVSTTHEHDTRWLAGAAGASHWAFSPTRIGGGKRGSDQRSFTQAASCPFRRPGARRRASIEDHDSTGSWHDPDRCGPRDDERGS